MPSIVALALCCIFVLFLLRLDRKQYPEASLALWIPTIWMLINATKPLAIWFGSGGATMEEGSPLDRNLLTLLAIVAIGILIKRGFDWSTVLKDNPWAVALLGFMLLSVLWSSMPFVSLKRWLRVFIAVLMALVVASEREPINALKTIFRRMIYILIPFSIMLIKYYPSLGVEYGRWSGRLMWIGVASQKNSLALLCLFSSIFLVWTHIQRRQNAEPTIASYQQLIDICLFTISIWMFLGPNHTPKYSATSTAALCIGLLTLAALFGLKRKKALPRANSLSLVVVCLIALGTLVPFFGALFLRDVAQFFGRDETLTGRSDIWAYLIPYASRHLLLGYGFGGFWTDAMRAATSSHAHNGYLDIILNTGLVGLALFSSFFITGCRRARECMENDFNWGCLWISILIMAVAHNMGESSVTGFTGLFGGTLLFMLIIHKPSRELSVTRPGSK